MHVKASGTWLRQAGEKNIFVEVDAAAIRRTLDLAPESLEFTGHPRPSIETAFHAVIRNKFVIHTHSVGAIALSAVLDSEKTLLKDRLADFRWCWIPYVKPGYLVALEILKGEPADVYVLQNHGVVFGADTIEQTKELISSFEEAVRPAARTSGADPDTALLRSALESGPAAAFALPERECIHQLALDEETMKFASGGVLYPDHAVYLGDEIIVISPEQLKKGEFDESGKFLIVAGAGVLARRDLNEAALDMLDALYQVASRIPSGSRVGYLSPDSVRELLDWDAEKYRQKLIQENKT